MWRFPKTAEPNSRQSGHLRPSAGTVWQRDLAQQIPPRSCPSGAPAPVNDGEYDNLVATDDVENSVFLETSHGSTTGVSKLYRVEQGAVRQRSDGCIHFVEECV